MEIRISRILIMWLGGNFPGKFHPKDEKHEHSFSFCELYSHQILTCSKKTDLDHWTSSGIGEATAQLLYKEGYQSDSFGKNEEQITTSKSQVQHPESWLCMPLGFWSLFYLSSRRTAEAIQSPSERRQCFIMDRASAKRSLIFETPLAVDRKLWSKLLWNSGQLTKHYSQHFISNKIGNILEIVIP